MVAMLLVAIVAGTVDYGLAWRSGVVATEATRAGARTGSAMARNPRADYEILSGVRASLISAGRLDELDRVVIFYSSTADGAAPASCLAATPSGSSCVVLNKAQLDAVAPSNFSYVPSGNDAIPPTGTGCMTSNRMLATSSWCPSQRVNALQTAQFLGVYVRLRTANLFPMLGSHQTIARQTVIRLEPDPA